MFLLRRVAKSIVLSMGSINERGAISLFIKTLSLKQYNSVLRVL